MSAQWVLVLLTIVFLPAYSIAGHDFFLWIWLVQQDDGFRRYFQEPFVVTWVCDRLSTMTNA